MTRPQPIVPDHLLTTEELKKIFLHNLRIAYTIGKAAQYTGVSRATIKMWQKSDQTFAKDYEDAREDAIDLLESALAERAHTKSDNAAMFILRGAKPQQYRDNINIDANILSANIQLSPEQYALIFQATMLRHPLASSPHTIHLPPPSDADMSNSPPAPANNITSPATAPEDPDSPLHGDNSDPLDAVIQNFQTSIDREAQQQTTANDLTL